MKIKRPISFLLLFISITLFSCSGETVFSEKYEFPKQTWAIDEFITFDAQISDVNVPYDVIADITATEEYRTSNIWLVISTKSPSGAILTDTAQFFLADGTGKWLGEKGGSGVECKFLYKNKIKFAEKGLYKFQLHHAMRKDDLPQLASAGITVIKSKAKGE